jgi:hypothetical protein
MSVTNESDVSIERRPNMAFTQGVKEVIDAACAAINRWNSDAPDCDIEIDHARMRELAAALKQFTQEVKTERFYAANRTQIEDTGHGTFHTVPTGLDTAEVAAALNALSPERMGK